MPSTDESDATRGGKRRKQWSRDAWIAVYQEKGTVTAACKALRISRQTAYVTRKAEPEFAAAWDREENSVTDNLEMTLVEVALEGTGSPQVRALEFALRSRRPEKYDRGQLHVKHSGTVKHDVSTDFDREVGELVAKMRENAAEEDHESLPSVG